MTPNITPINFILVKNNQSPWRVCIHQSSGTTIIALLISPSSSSTCLSICSRWHRRWRHLPPKTWIHSDNINSVFLEYSIRCFVSNVCFAWPSIGVVVDHSSNVEQKTTTLYHNATASWLSALDSHAWSASRPNSSPLVAAHTSCTYTTVY